MKTCRKFRKLIALTSIGAVSKLDRDLVSQHVTECEACGEYYRQVNRVVENLNSLQDLVGSVGQTKSDSIAQPVVVAGLPHRSWRVRTSRPAPGRGDLGWHLLLPALGILALLLLVSQALVGTGRRSPVESARVPVPLLTPDLSPTVANYRAVASQSLDELDELLSKQGNRPVSKPADSAGHDLALLGFGE